MIIEADIPAALGTDRSESRVSTRTPRRRPGHRVANQRVIQRHRAEHLHFIAESVNGLSHRFHRIDGKMQYHRRTARR